MTGSLESQNYEAHDCTLLAKLAADCLDWVYLNQLLTNLFENDGTWNRELEMNLKTKQLDTSRTQQTVVIIIMYICGQKFSFIATLKL